MAVTRSQTIERQLIIVEPENTQQNGKKRSHGHLRVESGDRSCVDLTLASKRRKGKEPEEENWHCFRELPSKLLLHIFEYLDIPTLLTLDCVSKTFETDRHILGALRQRWKGIQQKTYQGLRWQSNANKKNPHSGDYLLSKALADYLLARKEGRLKWQSITGKIAAIIQHCPVFIACVQFDCQTFGVDLPATFPSMALTRENVKQILADTEYEDGQGEFLLTILLHVIEYEEASIERASLDKWSKGKRKVWKKEADACQKLKNSFTRATRKGIHLALDLSLHILERRVSSKYYQSRVLEAAKKNNVKPLQLFLQLYECPKVVAKKGYAVIHFHQMRITRDFESNVELNTQLSQVLEDHPEHATEKSLVKMIYLKEWLANYYLQQKNIEQADLLTQEADQLYTQATCQRPGRSAAFLLSLGDVYANHTHCVAESKDAVANQLQLANVHYDLALAILDEQNIELPFEKLQDIAFNKERVKDWESYEKLTLKIIAGTFSELTKRGYLEKLANVNWLLKKWAKADHYFDEAAAKGGNFVEYNRLYGQIYVNYKLENWKKIDWLIKNRKSYSILIAEEDKKYRFFISIFELIIKQKLGDQSSNTQLYQTIVERCTAIPIYQLDTCLKLLPPEFKSWEIVITAAKEQKNWEQARAWLNRLSGFYSSCQLPIRPLPAEWLAEMLDIQAHLHQELGQLEASQLFSFLRNIAQSPTDQAAFATRHQEDISSLQYACCISNWRLANQALDQLLPHYQEQDMLTTDLLKACIYIKKQVDKESEALRFETLLKHSESKNSL